jgi:hypothetical protein
MRLLCRSRGGEATASWRASTCLGTPSLPTCSWPCWRKYASCSAPGTPGTLTHILIIVYLPVTLDSFLDTISVDVLKGDTSSKLIRYYIDFPVVSLTDSHHLFFFFPFSFLGLFSAFSFRSRFTSASCTCIRQWGQNGLKAVT